jgi:hypothetical protein
MAQAILRVAADLAARHWILCCKRRAMRRFCPRRRGDLYAVAAARFQETATLAAWRELWRHMHQSVAERRTRLEHRKRCIRRVFATALVRARARAGRATISTCLTHARAGPAQAQQQRGGASGAVEEVELAEEGVGRVARQLCGPQSPAPVGDPDSSLSSGPVLQATLPAARGARTTCRAAPLATVASTHRCRRRRIQRKRSARPSLCGSVGRGTGSACMRVPSEPRPWARLGSATKPSSAYADTPARLLSRSWLRAQVLTAWPAEPSTGRKSTHTRTDIRLAALWLTDLLRVQVARVCQSAAACCRVVHPGEALCHALCASTGRGVPLAAGAGRPPASTDHSALGCRSAPGRVTVPLGPCLRFLTLKGPSRGARALQIATRVRLAVVALPATVSEGASLSSSLRISICAERGPQAARSRSKPPGDRLCRAAAVRAVAPLDLHGLQGDSQRGGGRGALSALVRAQVPALAVVQAPAGERAVESARNRAPPQPSVRVRHGHHPKRSARGLPLLALLSDPLLGTCRRVRPAPATLARRDRAVELAAAPAHLPRATGSV